MERGSREGWIHDQTDHLGLLLHAVVHPANVQDRDGAILVTATLFGMFPFLQKLFADGGYQGPEFSTALAKVRPHLNVEIVKRSDQAKGFVVLSKRWIVNACTMLPGADRFGR